MDTYPTTTEAMSFNIAISPNGDAYHFFLAGWRELLPATASILAM
jgi:hypothetical protein